MSGTHRESRRNSHWQAKLGQWGRLHLGYQTCLARKRQPCWWEEAQWAKTQEPTVPGVCGKQPCPMARHRLIHLHNKHLHGAASMPGLVFFLQGKSSQWMSTWAQLHLSFKTETSCNRNLWSKKCQVLQQFKKKKRLSCSWESWVTGPGIPVVLLKIKHIFLFK